MAYPKSPIIRVHVEKMVESSGPSWWVTLTNAAGKTITPQMWKAPINEPGLSAEEARDRALIEVDEWADFLGFETEVYKEDGVVYEPSLTIGHFREDADV